MPESTPTVFVSYSYRDFDVLQTLRQELSSRGMHVWSVRDVRAGESFAERVLASLETATIYVLLLSQHYLESSNAMFESGVAYARALNHEAIVIPVLLTNIELPPHLAAIEHIDGRHLEPSEIARRVHATLVREQSKSEPRQQRTAFRHHGRAKEAGVEQRLADADWNVLTRRLLLFAQSHAMHDKSGKGLTAADYVTRAVSRFAEGKIADIPSTPKDLLSILLEEVAVMIREDQRGRPSMRRRRAAVESELDREFEQLATLSDAEVESRLRQFGIDPSSVMDAVSASIRRRRDKHS